MMVGRCEYMNKYINNPPSTPPDIQNSVVQRNKDGGFCSRIHQEPEPHKGHREQREPTSAFHEPQVKQLNHL